jgi:hypothetical protein
MIVLIIVVIVKIHSLLYCSLDCMNFLGILNRFISLVYLFLVHIFNHLLLVKLLFQLALKDV